MRATLPGAEQTLKSSNSSVEDYCCRPFSSWLWTSIKSRSSSEKCFVMEEVRTLEF